MRFGISVLVLFFLWVRVSPVLASPLNASKCHPGNPKSHASKVTIVADFKVHEDHPLVKDKIGVYQTPFMGIEDYFFYPSHPSSTYADFDPHTSIARVGMGTANAGTAVVANVYDLDSRNTILKVDITKSGPFSSYSINSIFGIRIEFQNSAAAYSTAALCAGKLYNPHRSRIYPWGTKRPADVVRRFTGAAFDIDLAGDAPANWNGQRIIIIPLLEDAGASSRACLHFRVVHP